MLGIWPLPCCLAENYGAERAYLEKGANEASVERFLADDAASNVQKETLPITVVDVASYDAVFLPGGHSTMWNLPESAELADLLRRTWWWPTVITARLLQQPIPT